MNSFPGRCLIFSTCFSGILSCPFIWNTVFAFISWLTFCYMVFCSSNCETMLLLASVCPLIDETSWCKFLDARDWLIKALIQSSVMGGVSIPSWQLFSLRWPSPGVYGLYGRINGELQEDVCQGRPSSAPIPVVSPCWTFHSKMGLIMDRKFMGLTVAQDIKKRWKEYTEEVYKKIFMTQIITMVWSLT